MPPASIPSLKIGFDARLAGPRHAGIGRYSEQLLQFLLKKKTLEINGKSRDIQWVVMVFPDHGMDWLTQLASKNDSITVHETNLRHYGLLEQTFWWFWLMRQQFDLLHVPHFNVPLLYTRPYVVTIHDLLWHKERDARATTLSPWQHRIKYFFYRLVSEQAIKRAEHIFVPSEQVAKDVATFTKRTQEVSVTYEGVAEPYISAFSEADLPKKKQRQPYLIYTGSLYPHKNVSVVLRALRHLPEFTLKVASARSVFSDTLLQEAQRVGVSHQLELLGRVPDEELTGLYQKAVALVQPSTSEGFGLTGLEAMAVGCPVIASDIPIFHEIYKDHVEFFLPHDTVGLVSVCKKLHEHLPSLTSRTKAARFAQSYRWDRMAKETWEAYQEVIPDVVHE